MRMAPSMALWATFFLLLGFTSHQFADSTGRSGETEVLTDSLFQKAVQLKTAQKFDSAALLFKTVSQEYEKQENREQYITSQRHLAYCLWVTHRGDQAIELSKRTIEEGVRWLGPEDIQIAKLYTVMGNVHADRRTKEDFDKCVAYYEKALEITRKFYGDGHPARAGSVPQAPRAYPPRRQRADGVSHPRQVRLNPVGRRLLPPSQTQRRHQALCLRARRSGVPGRAGLEEPV